MMFVSKLQVFHNNQILLASLHFSTLPLDVASKQNVTLGFFLLEDIVNKYYLALLKHCMGCKDVASSDSTLNGSIWYVSFRELHPAHEPVQTHSQTLG